MGLDVADTHFANHGEGKTAHTPRVRLHWGNKSIDETHDMSFVTYRLCVKYRYLNQGANFSSECGSWVDDNGSIAAKAEKAAFVQAAWYAL